MTLEDFIYRDISLSDMNGKIGYVVTSASQSVGMGSVLTLNTIKDNASSKNKLANVSYDAPIEVTFDIVRDTCKDGSIVFTDDEILEYMRWLNCKSYEKFIPIYDDVSFPNINYFGTFTTIQAITIGKDTVGFTVTFTTNSPFGYDDENEYRFSLTGSNSFSLYSEDNEEGKNYPYIEITLKENGNLTLKNSMSKNDVKINNCKNGEIITIDCENKVITSTNHQKLFNDFNYNYLEIINYGYDRNNIISANLKCDVYVRLSSRRKVGIFV